LIDERNYDIMRMIEFSNREKNEIPI
jgi:hypothetical protein